VESSQRTVDLFCLHSPAIGEYFEGIVKKHGDKIGLICKAENNLRWTWRQYDEQVTEDSLASVSFNVSSSVPLQVDALSRGLHDIGLRKGDRVGV
jgi:fatty-acyl-CoA synthase